MKIIATELHRKYNGIIDACKESFNEAFLWNPSTYPIYDMLLDMKPDLICIDLKLYFL